MTRETERQQLYQAIRALENERSVTSGPIWRSWIAGFRPLGCS
jgi:hypothetical protein